MGGADPELLRALLQRQIDVVWCMETEPVPHFVFVNDAAEEVLGLPAQVFLDDIETWFRMVHRADLPLLGIGAEPPPGPVETMSTIVRFFRPDGERRWVEVRWRRVDEGEHVRLYGVTRDVTDRTKEAQRVARARQRLAEAEALAGVGTYDWDMVNGQLWFSTNLIRLLGHDPETWEPTYEKFEAMMLERHRENARSVVARAGETGQSFHDDVEIQRPDGAVRMLDIVGLVDRDEEGALQRLHGVMRDVTEERATERARDLFIADAAHELRTPVTGVVGAAALVRDRVNATMDVDEALASALALLERQSDRLHRLSNSLLDLGSLDTRLAPVVLSIVELDVALAKVAALCPPPDHLVLELEANDLRVMADPWRLEQVLVNMITNAFRYARTRVSVAARSAEDGVVITVTDDGPGVDPEDAESLFEEFHRGRNEHGPGAGLGLAIVRRLAETMRGEVFHREAEGGGACFGVRLRRP